MKYILSNEAENDLENIWLYTFQTWSVNQANDYVNLIVEQIQHIANNPNSGKDIFVQKSNHITYSIKLTKEIKW